MPIPAAGAATTHAVGATDIGRIREHNEDAFCLRTDLGLFAVADGMGGHQAGDVASALVAEAMVEFFERGAEPQREPHYLEQEDRDRPADCVRLVASIRCANETVLGAAHENSERHGMGSTVVALHIPPSAEAASPSREAHIAHVGDSRCYRIRGSVIEQLTSDHSLVNEARAIDPSLTEEELASLPSNVITRALGLEAGVRVDAQTVRIAPGDVFVLCSDGLSGMISDRELLEALRLADDLSEASELLVALANENGGTDNITVLVVAPR